MPRTPIRLLPVTFALIALVFCSAAGIARAQDTSTPLITIDANVSNQFPLGSDQKVMPGNTTNQILFGGIASLHITPRWSIFYRKIHHDKVSGATNGSGYGTFTYDVEGHYGVAYEVSRELRLESFWEYGARGCCPGAGDPNAFSATSKTPAGPSAKRGFMNWAAWNFGPETRIGRPFSISEEAMLFEHHLDQTIADNPVYIKAGDTHGGLPNGPQSRLLWETHVYYNIPVFGQSKFVPFINYENKPAYDDNATQPTFENNVYYGANIHMSPVFSLQTYVKNQHTYSGSSAHATTLFTDLLIHLRS